MSPHKKFDYLYIPRTEIPMESGPLAVWLNDLGREGWEYCAPPFGYCGMVFKREVR